MIIFNIVLYITIGFIVYFGYQTVLHYHKHENINFLRGLIVSTLVLAASLQDKNKRKIELIASATLAVISLIALFIVVANVR